MAGVLDITLNHATRKHWQAIGLLEWSHAWVKHTLKIETGEWRSFWRKYVSTAVLNYNTSYHAVSQAEFFMDVVLTKSWIWNGVFAHSKHPFSLHKLPKTFLITQIIYEVVSRNAMQAHIKYKGLSQQKNPTLWSSKNQILYMSWNQKQVIRGVKFF